MKNILRLFLVPLVTLTFAGLSFAQGKPATPAPTPSVEKKAGVKGEKPKATSVTGEIISVDAKAGTLTVKAKDKEMGFTAETKGARAALAKVKVGERARVSYTERNGKLIAHSMTQAKASTLAKTKTSGKGMEKEAVKTEKK